MVKDFTLKRSDLRISILSALACLIPLVSLGYAVFIYFPVYGEGKILPVLLLSGVSFFTGISYLFLRREQKYLMENISASGKECQRLLSSDEPGENKMNESEEVERLVHSITSKINSYATDLKKYRERISFLNAKTQRKVVTLSNLIGLGELINSAADLDKISSYFAERVAEEFFMGFCAVFIRKGETYLMRGFVDNSEMGVDIPKVESRMAEIENFLLKKGFCCADMSEKRASWEKELCRDLNMNALFLPVKEGADIVGIVMSGTAEKNFCFSSEDKHIVELLNEELAVAFRTVSGGPVNGEREKEIIDRSTGFYNLAFFRRLLDSEIKKAFILQKPCSLIIVSILPAISPDVSEENNVFKCMVRRVSGILKEIRPPTGVTGSTGYGRIGLLLPGVNKKSAVEIAEHIRDVLEEIHEDDSEDIFAGLRVAVGVSENPIDGVNADELIEKAGAPGYFLRKDTPDKGRDRDVVKGKERNAAGN